MANLLHRWPLNEGTWRNGGDSTFTKIIDEIAGAHAIPTAGTGSIIGACIGALKIGMKPRVSSGSSWLVVSASDAADMYFGTNYFAISFYHRASRTDGASSTEELMALWDSSTNSEKCFKIRKINQTSQYKLQFIYWNGSSEQIAVETSWITTDRFEWHHFVIQHEYPGYSYKWYKDGSAVGYNPSGPTTLVGSGGEFYIFSDGSTTNATIDGALEMIEVWDYYLTSDEIDSLANRASELSKYVHRRAFPIPGTTRLLRLQDTASVNVAPHSSTASETDITYRSADSRLPFNYMREFNGSSSLINCGTIDVNVNYPAIMGWWVIDNDHISTIQNLVNRYDNSPLEGYRLYIENDILKWEVIESADNSLICELDLLGSTNGIIEKGPHHILALATKWRTCLYINSHIVDIRTPTSTPIVVDYNQSNTPLVLGREARASSGYFDGACADFVFNGDGLIAPWDAWSILSATRDPTDGLRIYNTYGNPIAVYNFNETGETSTIVKDSCGNHDGSVIGTVALVSAAISDQGRAHDGNSANYISIPHHSDFSIDDDFSILIWFTLNSVGALQALINKGDFASEPAFDLMVTAANLLEARWSTDNSNYLTVQAQPWESIVMQTEVLYFIGVICNQADKNIQIMTFEHPGKIVVASETGTYTGGDNTSAVKQGVQGAANSNPFNGNIEAWAWYPRAVAPVEIFNIYRASNLKVRA